MLASADVGDITAQHLRKRVGSMREACGKRRVIVPANAVWDDFFEAAGVDIGSRDQPKAQVRDEF